MDKTDAFRICMYWDMLSGIDLRIINRKVQKLHSIPFQQNMNQQGASYLFIVSL